MDPLSLTASIVAVVGAASTVAKSLEQLRTAFRDATTTVSALINEVSDLQIVLEACETAASKLESISNPPANLRLILEKTRIVLNELDSVVSCVLSPASDASLPRIAKLK
jgi:Fungal N-terminal domain of STAND proteins